MAVAVADEHEVPQQQDSKPERDNTFTHQFLTLAQDIGKRYFSSMANILRYGQTWSADADPLQIEFWAIRNLPDKLPHYLAAHRLLWPEDKQHRWFLLGMKSIVQNKISVFMGCASSGKTYTMACHALIDFFCFPRNSFSLISSTEKRSLEIKVWGRVKELFNRARRNHDWLDGYVLDSAMAITPDDIDEDNEFARELNRGIVCVPCVSGGRFVGMGKFQGAKPPNSPGKHDGILKHYGDEAAVMQPSFLDAYTNWMVNAGFKGVMSGNPTDISDPLCTAGEPEGGWDSFTDTKKTQEWTSKWYGAHVVAFDGRDSPNNDNPNERFPFLVSGEFVDELRATHGEDSWQLFQQGIGKPSKGMVSFRVITMAMCGRHHAYDRAEFQGDTTTIYALDPAYGGGDRCVGGTIRFGMGMDGHQILEVGTPEIIPIRLNGTEEAEGQIAAHVFKRMGEANITGKNGFYDSFGRGTLGNAFAMKFGHECPVPVDSGARPTKRPVRFDLFIEEKDGRKRLKLCDEHYSKFITELWFSTREAIESNQIRSLSKSVAYEGQCRLYSIVSGNRIEVEPKDDMKERIKKSPDLYDWFAIAIEGARQRGFKIQRIGETAKKEKKPDWLDKRVTEFKDMSQKRQLQTI